MKKQITHKVKCRVCGVIFDCRSLDEVAYHCGEHKTAPDIQYAGSKCVKHEKEDK